MGNIWLARKKKTAAYVSKEEYGCVGGAFYAGFHPKHFKFIEDYVSLGREGTGMHGERYISSPAAMRRFLETLAQPAAPARYCIFKPLSRFTGREMPETVTFFARMESLSGLATLVYFTTGDIDAVATRFGSACSHLIAWPRHYAAKGERKAVLGTFDPSARKFLKTDEMTLTIPLPLYDAMLEAAPESLLRTDTWTTVMKKVGKSNSVWNEG
ncbi:MAG: DUF169 domain-containing protein [Deltaproteobacteria bacterium]|nr:DUF169 domain-containing protein [Deltaproteobacteria bacterium]